MKKTIDKVVCDTDTATHLGSKYIGEFGVSDGYEEQSFVTAKGQHFLYGAGGLDSPYIEPIIKLLTDEQAEEWEKENGV